MMRFLFILLISFSTLPARAEVPIQEITSPGGIKAWLVQESSIPFVALEVMFKGGATSDPADKRGASNLMTALIEEGAGNMDAQEFAKRQEALAASFGFDVFDETMTVSARFLSENKEEAIELLRTALTDPRFDQDAIDRVRSQVLSIIASDEKDPNSIASKTFDMLAFGDHPYAAPLNGTKETVSSLTQEDMFTAHSRLLTRSNMFVGAVGDISPQELGVLLDHLLGSLPEGEKHQIGDVDFDLKGGTTVVDLPTPQSVALFGHSGIDRDDPDFFAAYLLNSILGGRGVESRLTREVREKRGLTYGVGTFLISKEKSHIMMGQVASANDRIAQAIDVIKQEWEKMAQLGVTADELAAAKTFLTGAYPLRFDGNATIAGILVGMQRQDLPIDYIATRNDRVNAVTLEDVNRVAAQLLQPENLHFVVVGQPEGLNQQ